MSDQQQQPAEQPAENKEGGDKRAAKKGGKGFGKGKGNRRGPREQKEEEWVPLTNLGRLVKMGKVKKLEQIFYHSIPIKEYQIVDELMKGYTLKDKVIKYSKVRVCKKAKKDNK